MRDRDLYPTGPGPGRVCLPRQVLPPPCRCSKLRFSMRLQWHFVLHPRFLDKEGACWTCWKMLLQRSSRKGRQISQGHTAHRFPLHDMMTSHPCHWLLLWELQSPLCGPLFGASVSWVPSPGLLVLDQGVLLVGPRETEVALAAPDQALVQLHPPLVMVMVRERDDCRHQPLCRLAGAMAHRPGQQVLCGTFCPSFPIWHPGIESGA